MSIPRAFESYYVRVILNWWERCGLPGKGHLSFSPESPKNAYIV
jgi:hypothetical protein